MKLQELAVANPIQQAAKVFESYFGNRVDFNTVSKGQARDMLKRVRGLIAEHRRTPEFHYSERNPSYLKLVMMEQALAAAATVPGAANPQAQAGMQAAQIQQKKKQIQDAIKAKQGEIAQLQKQMNDPTMMAMTEADLGNVAGYYKETQDVKKLTNWLEKNAGLPRNSPLYFDDIDLVYGDKTIVPGALVNPKLTFNDLLTAVVQASKQGMAEGVVDTVKGAVKKGLEKLGHGSDEDMRKDLQKKMGVPPTGKKPADKKMEESLMQEFANFRI